MTTAFNPDNRIRQSESPFNGENCDRLSLDQFQSAQVETVTIQNLVESSDYEWITPMNLPGLVVHPREPVDTVTQKRCEIANTMNEILETEDGDAFIPAQLPGRLANQNARLMSKSYVPQTIDAYAETDEYTELAAMQLPGRLKAAR